MGYLVTFKLFLNPQLLNSQFSSLLSPVCSLSFFTRTWRNAMLSSAVLQFLGTSAQRSTIFRASDISSPN